MEPDEMQKSVSRAEALEKKGLFVKAAEVYLKIGNEEKAAHSYEKGGAFREAEGLFRKLGKNEDAERCRKRREESLKGETWDDVQAEFQSERGNPY